MIIHKGSNPDIDSYSAFFDNKKLGSTEMEAILRAAGVTDCFVCGIAYDVCVGKSYVYYDVCMKLGLGSAACVDIK